MRVSLSLLFKAFWKYAIGVGAQKKAVNLTNSNCEDQVVILLQNCKQVNRFSASRQCIEELTPCAENDQRNRPRSPSPNRRVPLAQSAKKIGGKLSVGGI